MVEAQNGYGPKECVCVSNDSCVGWCSPIAAQALCLLDPYFCSRPSLQGLPSPKHQLTVRGARADGHTHPSGLHCMGELMALHTLHSMHA